MFGPLLWGPLSTGGQRLFTKLIMLKSEVKTQEGVLGLKESPVKCFYYDFALNLNIN